MLDKLFNLVREMGAEPVVNNPAVPNEQNDAVLASATESVTEALKSSLASGGLQQVLSLFGQQQSGGNLGQLPLVQMMLSSFTSKLTGQFGLNGNQATQVASSLIPSVLSQLVGRTVDPANNGFDLNSLVRTVTGSSAQLPDLNGLLSRFTSGSIDTNGDGKIDLQDIISKVSSAAQQPGNTGGGGIMDMLKGMMK